MKHNKQFSFDTINEFDNHISNSIMGYNTLHQLIVNISSFFIKNNTIPVDLGCTTGKLISKIQKEYECKCIGYDITDKQFIKGLDLRKQDITKDNFLIPRTNLIYSIFTMQFIDFKYRENVLRKIYNALDKNGALIICEKEICNNGIVQEVFTFSNYQYKQDTFSANEILDKEKTLRKIMNCLESKENIKLFKSVGFETIEPFFQSLNFKGYICKK